MCAIAYIFIYRKIPVNVLFCMLAIGMYWDLIVTGGGGGGGGGIGRVENLWLTSKLLYRDNDCAYNSIIIRIIILMKGAPTVKNRTF